MIRPVETVDPELLIEAYNVVTDNHGSGDDHVSILVCHFHDRLDAETLLAIDYRLIGLANIVKNDKPSPWIMAPKDKDYKLINEALLRAAASAPLNIDEDEAVGELSFDNDAFSKHALAASDTDGRA